MKWRKIKIALVLVLFILIVSASLVFPALGLQWQDKRMGNQVQFETTEEVVLSREDIFSLRDRISLFSGYNTNTQIAVISRNDSEPDEMEETMQQALGEEYKKLSELELLPELDFKDAEFAVVVEFWERIKHFVFDKNNPAKSMIIWTYIFSTGQDDCVVLNLEQESKKVLGFSYYYFIDDPGLYTMITEEKIHAFAGYLGYEVESVGAFDGNWAMRDFTEYTYIQSEYMDGSEVVVDENEAVVGGEDVWGRPWREIYQIVMEKEADAESDDVTEYRIGITDMGITFGEETFF